MSDRLRAVSWFGDEKNQILKVVTFTALEWFKRFPPMGTRGQLVQAQALISAGEIAQANALIRLAWINANYDVAEERTSM